MDDDDLLGDLIGLENRGWESLCDGSAADFYGAVMTGDGLMVLANGAVLDREAVVGALSDAPTWRAYEISGTRLVPAGRDAAALVYEARAWREDEAPAFVGAMASLYVRDEGEWRLALYTQTPVP